MSTPQKQNVLTNNAIDVVNLHSETDLTLDTNTQIRFSTSNILINYVPFDEYIRNVVFNHSISNSINESDIHTTWGGGANIESVTNLIDLTDNTSELKLDEIYTSGVSATFSQINNKHHYINISANNNIFLNNNIDIQNIAYKKYTDSFSDQLTSLSNYIHEVINGNFKIENVTPSTPSTLGNVNIHNKGVFIGNKLLVNKISTSTLVLQGSEPILNFDSMTAINFITNFGNSTPASTTGSKIFFGLDETSISLDTYIKSQLVEDPNSFIFGLNIQSGTEIVVSYINIASGDVSFFGFGNSIHGDIFNYTITYNMYVQDDFESGVKSTAVSTNVSSLTHAPGSIPSEPPTEFPQSVTFTGLVTGTTYMLYATLLNNTTDTVVENVLLGENIATIPNIMTSSVSFLNESTIRIGWTPMNIEGIDEEVSFNFILDWIDRDIDTTDLIRVNTNLTQNLNVSPPSSFFSYDFVLSASSVSVNYNSLGYYFKNDGGVGHDVLNTIIIETLPYNMQVSSRISKIQIDTAFYTTLSNTSITITSSSSNNYSISFNRPNTSNTIVTVFSYELYLNNIVQHHIAASSSGTNTYDYTPININDIIGDWKVVVKTLYNTDTILFTSPIYRVVQPSFNLVNNTPTPNGNKTFKFTISSPIYNTNYTLSGSNLTTSSNSTTVNTTVLAAPGSYGFTITLTDGLQLVDNKSTSGNVISIVSPSFNLSSPVFVVGSQRIFSVTPSSFSVNGSLSSVSMTSVTNGSFYSSGSSNSLIKFQFSNGISSGNKTVTVVVTDSWGYTVTKTSTINLNIAYTLTNNTISFHSTLKFRSNATGTSLTYNWNTGSNRTTSVVTLPTTYSGALYCTITETNSQGFTSSGASSSTITISQPTISSSSFSIASDETSYTYNINSLTAQAFSANIVIGLSLSSSSYSNVGGEDAFVVTNTTPISNRTYTTSTSLNKGTLYYLWGKITDGYGFGGNFTYLQLNVETPHIAPGPITMLNTDIEDSLDHSSMTIFWEYGDMGTATSAVMHIFVINTSIGFDYSTTVNYPLTSKLISGLSSTTQYNVVIAMSTNIDNKIVISGNGEEGEFTTTIDFSNMHVSLVFNDFGESGANPIYIKLYDGRHDTVPDFVSGFGRPVVWRETALTIIGAYYNLYGIRKRESVNTNLIIQNYNLNTNTYGIRVFNHVGTQTHHFQTAKIKSLLNNMLANDDALKIRTEITEADAIYDGYYLGSLIDYSPYFNNENINIVINLYPTKMTSYSGLTEELI
uniref:Uncharacterized protein n=1 Tax=Pyramimonas orientalis virus TaxID=455367 RepID=A0A7M3UPD2_POV01|nr:hypothetical protein HWQ62_00484 [Pyramimonas orientalis virus]